VENHVQRFSYSNNSAFNLGDNSPWSTTPVYLSNHFRCHPEIAQYANEEFYDSRWTISTLTDRLITPNNRKAGCHWTHVENSENLLKKGSYAPKEIDFIVDEIRMLQGQDFQGTIGIVTPFRNQANLLQDHIQQSIPRDFLERTRCTANTVHGFQGDERDVILFSLGCSFEMPGASKNFITNNPNLFNVAVTRAKTLLHIFGNQDWARTCGVRFIEKMARFCIEKPIPATSEENYGSPWERKLDEALKRADIKTISQYPIAGRFLDLAVITPSIKIDIEVDGWKYHTDDLGLRKTEDLWRDQLLKSLGWKVCRFWGWQLSQDMEGCVQEVINIINESKT
jgi:very-short-patch-repair endonuclease